MADIPEQARARSADRILPPSDRARRLLQGVDSALSQGTQLLRWWERTDAADAYTRRIELVRKGSRTGGVFAFFGEAPIDGQRMPVVGVVLDLFFDAPKPLPGQAGTAAVSAMRDQIREFVSKYLQRTLQISLPQLVPDLNQPDLPRWLRDLSWWPNIQLETGGSRVHQLYYKLRGSGQFGTFAMEERTTIKDLREIGTKYDWIVLQLADYGFGLTLQPFGYGRPQLKISPVFHRFRVLAPSAIAFEEKPGGDILGLYGPGYFALPSPNEVSSAPGLGPVEPAFDVIRFRVDHSGTVTVRSVFAMRQPERIFNLPLNPLVGAVELARFFSPASAAGALDAVGSALRQLPLGDRGFDPVQAGMWMANAFTGGWTARELCYSREWLLIQMLFEHCTLRDQEILNALQTWSYVANWLDPQKVPKWVRTGCLWDPPPPEIHSE
jgi:hypothetical protein